MSDPPQSPDQPGGIEAQRDPVGGVDRALDRLRAGEPLRRVADEERIPRTSLRRAALKAGIAVGRSAGPASEDPPVHDERRERAEGWSGSIPPRDQRPPSDCRCDEIPGIRAELIDLREQVAALQSRASAPGAVEGPPSREANRRPRSWDLSFSDLKPVPPELIGAATETRRRSLSTDHIGGGQ